MSISKNKENPDLREALSNFVRAEFAFDEDGKMPGPADPLLSSAGGVVDSMGLQRLIAFIEDDCGIYIDDTEILPENFETLACLVAFLESKQKS